MSGAKRQGPVCGYPSEYAPDVPDQPAAPVGELSGSDKVIGVIQDETLTADKVTK